MRRFGFLAFGAVAVLAAAGCGSTSMGTPATSTPAQSSPSGVGITTSDVQSFVQSNLPSSVTGVAGAPSDETVAVASSQCVQATSNTWNCDAAYTVTAPAESINQDYTITLNVTCDSTGTCQYPATSGTPVKS